MASQTKQEKKLMEEKIAKVKEVVRNVSNNVIVLALHNHDLDVEKTIHAFCEGGSESAIGDWEQTGSMGKKNQKKKSKPSSASSSIVSSSVNGKAPSNYSSSNSAALNGHSNGYSATGGTFSSYNNGGSKKVAAAENNAHSSSAKTSQAGKSSEPKPSKAVSSSSSVKPSVSASPKLGTSTPSVNAFEDLETAAKLRVIAEEANTLLAYASDVANLERVLDIGLAQSEQHLTKCFQEVRHNLAERERQLNAEMRRCREETFRVLASRRADLENLSKRSSALRSEGEQRVWVEELKAFNAGKPADFEIAHSTRFIYDNAKLVNEIGRLGTVVSVKQSPNSSLPSIVNSHQQSPMAATQSNTPSSLHSEQFAVNHSTSHSSLVSSVGEDSGLGQISPVHQDKNVAEVKNGGIVMASDALSADQLVDLQRRIEDTLRAKGIDPSVLSDIGVNAVAPRRRPPPANKAAAGGGSAANEASNGGRREGEKPKNAANNKQKNGGGGGQSRNSKNKVDLSILQ